MDEELDNVKFTKRERIRSVVYPLVAIMLVTWTLGAIGVSLGWFILVILGTWAFVRGVMESAMEDVIRRESVLLQRQRALQGDETCEWLNFLFNRWWLFSSGSIFSKLKTVLEPRLHEAKPSFVETISLKELNLGDQTPLLRSAKSWDALTPFRSGCSFRSLKGLAIAPTHSLALLGDLIFDSSSFSAILSCRVGHKGMGVDLDISVEQLVLEGAVLVTLFLDSDVPFPHVARLTFSFTDRPKVTFRVKILKSVQMMEVPVLKTWLHSLVTDALANAWVDPGQLELNIHSSDGFVPAQRPGHSLAQGVLTVTFKIQRVASCSVSMTEDDKWVVVAVGGKTHMSPPMKSPAWSFTCSFLLSTSLAATTLVVKVKSKRLITTTLTQFDLPIAQYNLDHCKVAETVLHKKCAKVMGGSLNPLQVKLEFHPLKAVNLDAPIPESSGSGAGVLYIVVHGADNLVPSGFSPSPYCLVFNSRKKVKTTHYVAESINPRWECGMEVLVMDIASSSLTFLVCSLPRNAKLQDGDLLGIHTFHISSHNLPFVRKQLPLHKNISSPFPLETVSKQSGSTVTVSVVFRAVPSISSTSSGENPNFRGIPLPIPFTGGSPVGSPCLVSSSSSSVGPSITPPFPSSPKVPRTISSSGCSEDEDQISKKKGNNHWINQAKNFLGSSHESDGVRCQDLENIFACGLGLIELTVIRARDLVARDLNGFSDPYCVVKVNGDVKYRTRVKKKTLHPEWNESFMTHLPKKEQSLDITLWDHDAFGMKDFLGSVSLKELDVRDISSSNGPVWCTLEGVKSGSLEVALKVISEDSQFDKGNKIRESDGGTGSREEGSDGRGSPTESTISSLDSETDEKEFMSKINAKRSSLRHRDCAKKNVGNEAYSSPSNNKSSLNCSGKSSLLRTASNPLLSQNKSKDVTGNRPFYTPSRPRKSGAEILASALALAKAESSKEPLSTVGLAEGPGPGPGLCSNLSVSFTEETDSMKRTAIKSSSFSSPLDCANGDLGSIPQDESKCRGMESRMNCELHSKDEFDDHSTSNIPKISLNCQIDDDQESSDGSSISDHGRNHKKAKSKVRGLKAMRQKVYQPSSYENSINHSMSFMSSSYHNASDLMSMKSVVEEQSSQSGVGGGEDQFSEPEVIPADGDTLAHALSQPNLSKPLRNGRVWIPIASPISTQVSSSSSVYISDDIEEGECSTLKRHHEDDIQPESTWKLISAPIDSPSSLTERNLRMWYPNVRGILKRGHQLHMAKSGLQIFVRIRVSDDRGGGKTTTKTAGRSRLVPSSAAPEFQCEWGLETDLSYNAQIIIEVRTSSRDLMYSICVPLGQLFKGFEDEDSGEVEKWITLDGGASMLLKVQFGGDPPPLLRRKSLFGSWSIGRSASK